MYGLNVFGSGHGPVTGYYESSNELSVCVNSAEFHDLFFQLLAYNNGLALWR